VSALALRLRPDPRAALTTAAAAGLALVLAAVAVVSPLLAAGGLVAALFVLALTRSLAAGVAIFAFMTYFEFVPQLTESGVTFLRLAGVVLALVWVAGVVTRGEQAQLLFRDRPLAAWAAVGLAVWATASALWAMDSGVALANAFRLTQGILLAFVVYTALREPRHLRWLFVAIVAGAVMTTILGGVFVSPEGQADELARLAGGIGDANQFAALLITPLAVSAFVLAGARGLARAALLGVVLLLTVALLLSQSRGGLVSLAVVLVFTVVLAGPVRPRAVVAVLAIVAVGVTYLVVLAPAATLERVTTFANAGGTGRGDLWNVALRVAEDHPLLGVGAGNFILVEPEYSASGINISRIDIVFDQTKVVHNTFLQLLTELGAIGLAAFLLVVGAAVVGSFRAISRMRGVPLDVELLVRGFTVGLLGVLAAYSFESSQYEKQLWLLLGVGLAIPSILRRLQAEAAQPRREGD
jgi:O-antigen ligase